LDLVEKEMKNRADRAERTLQVREKLAFGKIDASGEQKDLDRKAKLHQWIIGNKVNRVKFAADLQQKVKAKKMTPAGADQALADFDEVTSSADKDTSPSNAPGM